MKKLLFISLVFLGALSLASCKKTVQPSAFTPESTPYSASFIGTVQFKDEVSSAVMPVGGDCVTVTAQLMNGNELVADWIFSAVPAADGKFGLTVPMKKGGEKSQKYAIKAVVRNPYGSEFVYESDPVIANNVSSGQTKELGSILCKKKEE